MHRPHNTTHSCFHTATQGWTGNLTYRAFPGGLHGGTSGKQKPRRERKKEKMALRRSSQSISLTVKEKAEGTLQTFLEDFSAGLKEKLGRHVYNIRHQYAAIRSLKDSLKEDELVLHIDFAENFQCKYSSEVQAVHFGDSHHQVSLHTGVAYTCREVKSLCSISPSYRHDPSAIWAHLTPVLTYLREKYPEATTLHVVSD